MKKKYSRAEIAKIWRKKLKEELEDLSSLEFQKKVWIERPPDIWWDWPEVVASYFDDLWLNEWGNDKKEGLQYHVNEKDLTREEAEILKPFSDAFGKYADKKPDWSSIEAYRKILADPEWIKITEMAKEILTKIDFNKLP